MYEVTPQGIRDAAFGIDLPAGATDEQIQRLIDKAETRLNAAIPTLPARWEAGTVDHDVVQGVIEDMVLRVVKNPRALRSVGIDDFSATIDNSASTGLLYVSDSELSALAPRGSRLRVGSIRVGVPAWRLPGA